MGAAQVAVLDLAVMIIRLSAHLLADPRADLRRAAAMAIAVAPTRQPAMPASSKATGGSSGSVVGSAVVAVMIAGLAVVAMAMVIVMAMATVIDVRIPEILTDVMLVIEAAEATVATQMTEVMLTTGATMIDGTLVIVASTDAMVVVMPGAIFKTTLTTREVQKPSAGVLQRQPPIRDLRVVMILLPVLHAETRLFPAVNRKESALRLQMSFLRLPTSVGTPSVV